MNKSERMNELGVCGEKIIANLLSSLGLIVEHSENKHDSEKDLIVNGKLVEVKTQVPYLSKNCFSIRPDQLKKCRSVDVLYFISVPIEGRFDEYAGWIFRADPKDFKIGKYTLRDGTKMLSIKRNQEYLHPIKKMTSYQIKQVMKYSITGFGKSG